MVELKVPAFVGKPSQSNLGALPNLSQHSKHSTGLLVVLASDFPIYREFGDAPAIQASASQRVREDPSALFRLAEIGLLNEHFSLYL